MMLNTEFVKKAIDIAKNYKTLYVMGCFGAPLNVANKTRYCNNHSYNKKSARTKMIKAASADTFGFDCVNLIKAILWGWNGDLNKTYGGAKYNTNGVPDISADQMIKKCYGVSTTGWDKMVPGEALWCPGHIGIYIGDGLAVESSPAFANKVQITAVRNIGTKAGYSARTWTKHGKLPYITYTETTSSSTPIKNSNTSETKTTPKKGKDNSAKYGVRFKTTASALNVRREGVKNPNNIIKSVPKNTKVIWYGYYQGNFYYVQFEDKSTGYVSKDYLVRT